MTHPNDIRNIKRQAAILVGRAEALGVTLRINVEPLQPLAMGNTRHTVEAWPARKGPQLATQHAHILPMHEVRFGNSPIALTGETLTREPGHGPVTIGKNGTRGQQLDPAGEPKIEMTFLERKALQVLNSLKASADGGMLQLPSGVKMDIDVILMTATQRRVGVA